MTQAIRLPRGFVLRPAATPAVRARHGDRTVTYVAGWALSVLAVVLFAFVLELVAVSPIQHARAQQRQYAAFRSQLANAYAPTGPTNPDGTPLSLGTPMAVLSVPALGMSHEVVGEGTTSQVLSDGPGHRRDTVFPGQAGVSVIYGRRTAFGGPFGGLERLRAGDRITATTGLGTATYVVLDVRRAGDPLPPAPATGQGRLVLVTAAGSPLLPDGVLDVDARLDGAAFDAPGAQVPSAAIVPAERVLAGDPVAWLPTMLWAQALLVVGVAVLWLRVRWGARQAWIAGVPAVLLTALGVASNAAALLPNLL